MTEIEQLEQQNRKLRRRGRGLTIGWLLSVLVLGGAGIGAFYYLERQQQKLASEITSVAAATVELSYIKQLETQLQDLTKQQEVLPELSGNVKTSQAKIAVLNQRIDNLDQQVEQRQESLNTLTETLQDLVDDKQDSTKQKSEDIVPPFEKEIEPSSSDDSDVGKESSADE